MSVCPNWVRGHRSHGIFVFHFDLCLQGRYVVNEFVDVDVTELPDESFDDIVAGAMCA